MTEQSLQDFNPYEPPKADMNEMYSQADDKFYVVSLKKMIILTFATLGLYVIYLVLETLESMETSNR